MVRAQLGLSVLKEIATHRDDNDTAGNRCDLKYSLCIWAN